jgi:hypothetical protein
MAEIPCREQENSSKMKEVAKKILRRQRETKAMTGQEIDELMAAFDVFDNALIFHSYKNYMRDYELIVEVHIGPALQGTYSYLFRYCVETDIRTSLNPNTYRESLDDRLIDYETGKDLDGYVWGVKWSQMYPGWKRNAASQRAAAWSEQVGLEFHEVVVETNAFLITLVFASLHIEQVSDRIDPGIHKGYIPLR